VVQHESAVARDPDIELDDPGAPLEQVAQGGERVRGMGVIPAEERVILQRDLTTGVC